MFYYNFIMTRCLVVLPAVVLTLFRWYSNHKIFVSINLEKQKLVQLKLKGEISEFYHNIFN